jgi:hypothetical protein
MPKRNPKSQPRDRAIPNKTKSHGEAKPKRVTRTRKLSDKETEPRGPRRTRSHGLPPAKRSKIE